MPNTTGTPTTFADIIEYLEAEDGLTKIRRRDLISALRTMARFFHKDSIRYPPIRSGSVRGSDGSIPDKLG